MKKIAFILVSFMILLLSACSINTAKTHASNDESITKEYVESNGYKIISTEGEVDRYKLEKDKIIKGTENNNYQIIWGLQKDEPSIYFGKEIITYQFTVKNHPLQNVDANTENGVKVFIMICNGEVIGGYSYPNADVCGSVYSLDGKTLEQVTGLSFEEWSDKWDKKYSN